MTKNIMFSGMAASVIMILMLCSGTDGVIYAEDLGPAIVREMNTSEPVQKQFTVEMASAASQDKVHDIMVISAAETMDVRTGPGMEYESAGQISAGTETEVVCQDGEWLGININDDIVYIPERHAEFVYQEIISEDQTPEVINDQETEVVFADKISEDIEPITDEFFSDVNLFAETEDVVDLFTSDNEPEIEEEPKQDEQIEEQQIQEEQTEEHTEELFSNEEQTDELFSNEEQTVETVLEEQTSTDLFASQEQIEAQELFVSEEQPLTEDELLLASIIYCEAGNQPYEGQVAVGAVVINRVNSSEFPNTISDVIYQAGQFTPVTTGKFQKRLSSGQIQDSCLQVAREALAGVTPVGNCLYFHRYDGCNGIIIGDHVFK